MSGIPLAVIIKNTLSGVFVWLDVSSCIAICAYLEARFELLCGARFPDGRELPRLPAGREPLGWLGRPAGRLPFERLPLGR